MNALFMFAKHEHVPLLPLSFREKLNTRQTLVTVELNPPKGTDITSMLSRAKTLIGKVDAINVPDCQRSILKMSAMAAAKLIQDDTGIETVWQMTCRDRNLIALQADLMGGYALGLTNILALTGDPVQVGDHKSIAKQVFHLESSRLLSLISTLNKGQNATGAELRHNGTQFTVGAALNPLQLSRHAQQRRLKNKLERGVDFFQTQPIYNPDVIDEMNTILAECCNDVGCKPPRVLIGIVPPSSAKSARFMNAHVAGISIPESFIDILERSDNPKEESIAFCADVVEGLKPVATGFHFMPVAMEKHVARLLDRCFTPAKQPTL